MRANFTQYDNDDLRQKDMDHNIHPWTDFATFKEEGSEVMAEADGVYVYNAEGERYMDGIGGLWCVNIGYGRDEMAQAIADQVRRIPYYSTFTHLTTPPAAELAAKLAEIAPASINHVFYGTGGSMANDTAIRVIHFYFNRLGKPEKKKIISRVDAYHGSTYLAMTLTGVKSNHVGFGPRARPGALHPRAPHLSPAGRHERGGVLRREGGRPGRTRSWSSGRRTSPASSPSRSWAAAG